MAKMDKAMSIEVRNRGERLITTLELSGNQTLGDLKKAMFRAKRRYHPSRQYFTLGSGPDRVPLKDESETLNNLGLSDGSVLYFKDLGPQIGWRTVFFIEYAGPLFIHMMLYFFPQWFYSDEVVERQFVQKIAIGLASVHYIKRELESAFVHRFSAGTMPLRNVFKNSLHYWVFGGVLIAYPVYHPHYTSFCSDQVAVASAAVFLFCMFGNLVSHIILRNLRPAGSRVRRIPRGFLFEFVSCPNYTFEIGAWIAFAVLTRSLASYFFLVVSAIQMCVWAQTKHSNYRKEFNGKDGRALYPRSRKALVPLLL